MANLTWFQYDVAVWEQRTRELGLSLEEEGALMRLVRAAWQQPIPSTIPDSEDEFARILGVKWKKAVPLIRRLFTPDETHPGRLHSALVVELFNRAMQKHVSYVDRGKQGGRPKKAAKKPEPKAQLLLEEAEKKAEVSDSGSSGSGNQSSASIPLARENKAEGNTCAPTEHTGISPALGSALALEGARATGATLAAGFESIRTAITSAPDPARERLRLVRKEQVQ